MIFNRVTGLDLQRPGNVQPADAPVRYPFIWDAPRQDRTQWTGAAPNGTYLRGMARNTGEVFGVFGRFDPVAVPVHQILHRNSVKLANLQLIEEKVVALRPPPWPRDVFGFDQARAVAGAQVFAANCAGCHAPTPSKLVRNTWNTPVQNVGTDRRTVLNTSRTASPGVLEGTQQPPLLGPKLGDPALDVDILANAVVGSLLRAALLQDPAIHRAINRDLAEDRVPAAWRRLGSRARRGGRERDQDALHRGAPGTGRRLRGARVDRHLVGRSLPAQRIGADAVGFAEASAGACDPVCRRRR